jgi:hypothetical protein
MKLQHLLLSWLAVFYCTSDTCKAQVLSRKIDNSSSLQDYGVSLQLGPDKVWKNSNIDNAKEKEQDEKIKKKDDGTYHFGKLIPTNLDIMGEAPHFKTKDGY